MVKVKGPHLNKGAKSWARAHPASLGWTDRALSLNPSGNRSVTIAKLKAEPFRVLFPNCKLLGLIR